MGRVFGRDVLKGQVMNALRTFQPFAAPELFRRARPADFLEPAMQRSLRESDLLQREAERSCYRNLDKAVKAHAAVIQMASHGRIGQERAKEMSWREKFDPINIIDRGRWPDDCTGEMACTAGEEPPMPWWTPSGALFAAVAVGVILLGVWLY